MEFNFNIDLICFRKLRSCDLNLMHKWLNCDFVKEWYGKKNWTMKEIEDKYTAYINREKPTDAYIIYYGDSPLGYIQTYKIQDYADYAELIKVEENAAGLDIFIGEQDYFHKGLGKHIIRRFLKEVVFSSSDVVSCILGPEPKNKIAIKTYERVGFKHIKTIQTEEEEFEYIMRISKEEAAII